MAPAARGLLDTSVFIAAESARRLDGRLLPDQGVVCPVTIAELQTGVLAPLTSTSARAASRPS